MNYVSMKISKNPSMEQVVLEISNAEFGLDDVYGGINQYIYLHQMRGLPDSKIAK